MSIRIVADTHGLEPRMAQAPALINAGLERVVMGATIDAEGSVISHTPVGATGNERASMTHSFNGSGVSMAGRVYSSDVPIKTASVETGRAPGRMPPLAPIELWVARKLGVPADQQHSVAFLVARAIGKRGTKGAFMFRAGAQTARESVARRMAALRAEIGRLL